MKAKLNTAPTISPLSLAEVKSFLKIDVATTAEDADLQRILDAVTDRLSDELDLKIMAQKWDVYLDNFPIKRNSEIDKYESGDTVYLPSLFSSGNYIELPFGNLTAVDSFTTYDEDDNGTVFDPANYEVDKISNPPRLSLRRQAIWPSTVLRNLNGIKITCSIGYALAASVPAYLKQAILIYVAALYECRGDDSNEESGRSIPKAALALINSQKVYKF